MQLDKEIRSTYYTLPKSLIKTSVPFPVDVVDCLTAHFLEGPIS